MYNVHVVESLFLVIFHVLSRERESIRTLGANKCVSALNLCLGGVRTLTAIALLPQINFASAARGAINLEVH